MPEASEYLLIPQSKQQHNFLMTIIFAELRIE